MKEHWQEQILRHANGQSSAEESAALEAALHDDAELRAWYLDYMNLDVALGAAAEAAAGAENGFGGAATSPQHWRWLATAAACAALFLVAALLAHRPPPPERPDVAAACASVQSAIERLSIEVPSSFPAWASPTAGMLEQPRIPTTDPKS